jgi:catechol 2,3-dioxygenase-like lactoylglutathione lyase family enzyme
VSDRGLTHVALQVRDLDRSIAFYGRYAAMQVVHAHGHAPDEPRVAWLSDGTRPFVIVLAETEVLDTVLRPFAHLGVGCASREEVDRLCDRARSEGRLVEPPKDHGYPVGYAAFLSDPDGHTLELSHGQEVGLAVAESDVGDPRHGRGG